MTNERVKSDLQVRLELVGWELLTNENPGVDSETSPMGHEYVHRRISPKSDLELDAEYRRRSIFSDVLVTDAFDIYGNPIEDLRAIYVKREQD